MQKLIQIFLFAALAVSVQAAPKWLTNLEQGHELAKKENKVLLVNFTGRDWCPPCKVLKKNVLDTADFEKFAQEKLVLVEIDFPLNKKKQSKAVRETNEALLEEYKVEQYPTVILMDKAGKELGRMNYDDEALALVLAKLETLIAKAKP